jgi:acetyltransferase
MQFTTPHSRAGIVRVETISDLFNCGVALSTQPNPKGVNLTIVTNAGGPAIMATDQLISLGGKLANLEDDTIAKLKQILPPYCSIKNPVDIYEEAPAKRFKKVLEICLKDPNSDGLEVIYAPLRGNLTPLGLQKPFQIRLKMLVSLFLWR